MHVTIDIVISVSIIDGSNTYIRNTIIVTMIRMKIIKY